MRRESNNYEYQVVLCKTAVVNEGRKSPEAISLPGENGDCLTS